MLELTLLRLDEAEVSDQEVHEFARAEMKKRDIAGAVDRQVRPKVAKATADARYKAQMDIPITMESDCRRDGEQVANALKLYNWAPPGVSSGKMGLPPQLLADIKHKQATEAAAKAEFESELRKANAMKRRDDAEGVSRQRSDEDRFLELDPQDTATSDPCAPSE